MKIIPGYFVFAPLICLFLAFNIQAALYQVVEVESPTSTEETYGIAIEKLEEYETTDCFSDSCDDSTYLLAGDTLNATEGFSLKEEVMFDVDSGFFYLDYDDLEDYCDSEYGYATCEYWAYLHWYGDTDTDIGGLKNEREAYYEASYQTNATAFYDTSTYSFEPDEGDYAPSVNGYMYTYVTDTDEKVVNALDDDDYVIGNTSSGYYNYGGYYIRLYRNRGYYVTDSGAETVLQPEPDTSLSLADEGAEETIIQQMGGTMAFDSFTYDGSKYIVGSAAVATFYYDDSSKDYDSENTSDSDEEDVTNCVDYDDDDDLDDDDDDYTDPALYPECQNFGFATRAFVWNISDAGGPNTDANRFSAVEWETDTTADGEDNEYSEDETSAQASIRAAVISDRGSYATYPVLVGYNTYMDDDDNFLMQAAVFRPTDTDSFTVDENEWSTTFISNTELEDDGDYIYSNSMATDINENMIVIGHVKRDGDYPSDGVSDNRMFVADANDTTPSASFFTSQGEDIFFDSAAGQANAINNYNEIVGQVDAEDHREVGGKQRDHRGFIYPYYDTGTDDDRRARFNNQAWWLDDLTNGGDYSSANNHFRIIDAGDINDAGVISATALECFEDEDATTSMEYDSTEHFAYCNEGIGDERIVAVMLIPIQNATSDDISEREEDSSTSSRSGAGLGWLVLMLLSLVGVMRRYTIHVHMI